MEYGTMHLRLLNITYGTVLNILYRTVHTPSKFYLEGREYVIFHMEPYTPPLCFT